MTDDKLALVDLLQKSGDGDFLRAVAEAVLQILMEAGVEGLIGAGRHERSADRLNYRNGYREGSLDTRLGSLQLRIPKLRQGSYFPPFLEPRKTAEKALITVIQEAWVGGVSTEGGLCKLNFQACGSSKMIGPIRFPLSPSCRTAQRFYRQISAPPLQSFFSSIPALIKDIHILQQSEQQLRDEAAQRRQEVESLRQENVVLEQEVGALRNSRVL